MNYEKTINKLEFEVNECKTLNELEDKRKEIDEFIISQKLIQFQMTYLVLTI